MSDMENLTGLLKQQGASFMPFGPPEHAIQIAESFGEYAAEYAAIRQRVGILHEPQRGLLELTGADCRDFLHRLITQDINSMKGGDSRRSFVTNRMGRICADIIVHFGNVSTWIETDVMDIPKVHKMLEDVLFTEDVTIKDISSDRSTIALHGPACGELLAAVSADDVQPALTLPHTHHVLKLAGEPVAVWQHNPCGVRGVRLSVPMSHAQKLYEALLEAAGYDPSVPSPIEDPQAAADAMAKRRGTLRGRPIGWLAFNTARIEAGTPLFHIDFGTDSLPHETGILKQAVSFTKGCYVGQEIVARMESRGHPGKVLVGLKCLDERQPITAAQVFDTEGKDIIGAVTSSTVSPLLGKNAIAFAMMKWDHREPGGNVLVAAEGELAPAVVNELAFVKP